MNQADLRPAADPLLLLLELARRARAAQSAEELAFLLVNDSIALQPYRQGALWLADPDHGQVWRLDPASCPVTAPLPACVWTPITTGGTPRAIAGAAGKVYVGHAEQRHLSVLDGSGKLLPAIAMGPACADGIDDDKDGLIDRDDPGCTDPDDDDEASPAPPAGCSDGIDGDQDGATDFPADSGCTGFGDPSEDSAPAATNPCANGIDDDGDGATDLDEITAVAVDVHHAKGRHLRTRSITGSCSQDGVRAKNDTFEQRLLSVH